jgi:hypothetical protein
LICSRNLVLALPGIDQNIIGFFHGLFDLTAHLVEAKGFFEFPVVECFDHVSVGFGLKMLEHDPVGPQGSGLKNPSASSRSQLSITRVTERFSA